MRVDPHLKVLIETREREFNQGGIHDASAFSVNSALHETSGARRGCQLRLSGKGLAGHDIRDKASANPQDITRGDDEEDGHPHDEEWSFNKQVTRQPGLIADRAE